MTHYTSFYKQNNHGWPQDILYFFKEALTIPSYGYTLALLKKVMPGDRKTD